MNYKKIIRQNFDFLCNCGYVCNDISENTDTIIQYVKNENSITVWRVLHLANCYDIDKSIDENLKNCFYVISISIKRKDKSKNIFECGLFSEYSIIELKKEIESCHSEIKQLEKYSQFIKNNLNLI